MPKSSQTTARPAPEIQRTARRFGAPVGTIAILVVCFILLAALLYRGYSFYSLSLDERLGHSDFRRLNPGEDVGHGYGIIGTSLIVLNLLYLVRRRLARLPLGPMRVWLDFHVATGFVGSILVLFHSAFQLRTTIATVTATSLFFVVITGIVGRYLYALQPANKEEQLKASLESLDALVSGLGRNLKVELHARTIPGSTGTESLLGTLATIPSVLREMRARGRLVRSHVATAQRLAVLGRGEIDLLDRARKRTADLATAQVKAVFGANLLRTWRGLHRLLAILMLLSVSVHIGVAWYYGYRWLWSE